MKSSQYYWSNKPLWCQPWTILLSGLLIISTSFYLLNNILITLLFTVLVVIWWILFLFIAPSLYDENKNSL